MRMQGECPDQCNGKGLNRQMDVPRTLLDKFSPAAVERLQELGSPKRCTYCGCVHAQGIKVGDWDSGVLGQGWQSHRYPA